MRSPYVGLAPYAAEDAALFFGRSGEVDVVVANLMSRRLTVLFGDTGVGKSSLLLAGVLPHMRRLAEAEGGRGSGFAVAACRSWQGDVTAALRAAIQEAAELDELPATDDVPAVLEAAVRRRGELFLIVDQFEEYFTYHEAEWDDGVAAVFDVTRGDVLPVNVLVSLRQDAVARLDLFKGRAPRLFDNLLRIDHLDRQAAREAIERPLEVFSRLTNDEVGIEPALVEQVIEQCTSGRIVVGSAMPVQSARIETPYLQLVMHRLWEAERERRSRVLRLATLVELGGVENITRTHLERSLAVLSPRDRDVAADLFRYLVTPSGTKIAHTAADLSVYAERSREDVERVLAGLARPDVRVVRPVALGDEHEGRYEVFHDVLIAPILEWIAAARGRRRRRRFRLRPT